MSLPPHRTDDDLTSERAAWGTPTDASMESAVSPWLPTEKTLTKSVLVARELRSCGRHYRHQIDIASLRQSSPGKAIMGKKAHGQDNALTDYEMRQIEKIAVWKSSNPNPLVELFHEAAKPFTRLVQYLVPDTFALGAIEAAYKASEADRHPGGYQGTGGDFGYQRASPWIPGSLRQTRLAGLAPWLKVLRPSRGALTGAGGVWTTLLDVPLLFTLCLRSIIKSGHCYGYPLDRPSDKAWVLGALAVALSDSKEQRHALMKRLREIEELLLEEVQEDILVQETASLLTQIEVFEDIPLFGAATGRD